MSGSENSAATAIPHDPEDSGLGKAVFSYEEATTKLDSLGLLSSRARSEVVLYRDLLVKAIHCRLLTDQESVAIMRALDNKFAEIKTTNEGTA